MRHFSKLAVMALACSLWSCSDDAPVSDTGKQGGENDFYAKITLKLPTEGGSRAGTQDPDSGNDPAQSTDGYEYGKDSENKVNNITVVLATKTSGGSYSFVTSSNGTPLQNKEEKSPTFVMSFDAAKIKDNVGETLYIFAYCNQTPDGVDNFDAKGSISEGSLNAGSTPIAISIAQPNNFLMTNSSVPSVIIPEWSKLMADHNKISNPFPLGTVPVERVACRFDFQSKKDGEVLNTYPIYEQPSANEGEAGVGLFGNIQLQEMALFNEAKEFHYLRHMSADGTMTGATICTPEYGNPTTDNYVVGPNCALYRKYDSECATKNAALGDLENLFHFPMSTIAKNAVWTKIADLKEDDTHSGTQSPTWTFTDTDYKIWRYATENPIPSISAQRHGISTGVVFKGQLTGVGSDVAGAGELAGKISAAISGKKVIYAYRETPKESSKSNLTTIFGSSMDLYLYCKSYAGTDPRKKFVEAVNDGVFVVTATPAITAATATEDDIFGEGVNVTNVSEPKVNADLKPYNFIAYAPSADGNYYTYYYYFNRHNDNGLDYEMGPMEFATVRNNIYKLKVDMVSALGLPEDTPPDPWTPDENPQVYFKVSVKVLDWVVRKNSIKF